MVAHTLSWYNTDGYTTLTYTRVFDDLYQKRMVCYNKLCKSLVPRLPQHFNVFLVCVESWEEPGDEASCLSQLTLHRDNYVAIHTTELL